MTKKILHISGADTKFILPFRVWLEKNLKERHLFFISNISVSQKSDFNFENIKSISPYDSSIKLIRILFYPIKFIKYIIILSRLIKINDQIYLHGLFDKKLIIFLYLNPSLNKKVKWIIWGGGDLDLTRSFSSGIMNKIECVVKSRFKSFITYVDEDFIDVLTHYNPIGYLENCLLYSSNVFTDSQTITDSYELKKENKRINVLVGHSADHEGDHINMLNRLHQSNTKKNLQIYCILSYGEKPWTVGYKDEVIELGRKLFGDSFTPIENFLPKDSYLTFLSSIDIFILNHRYQQGMGNIIQALGMNKAVFLNSESNHFKMFKRLGLDFYSTDRIDSFLDAPNFDINNKNTIEQFFSEKKLLNGWKNIFENDN